MMDPRHRIAETSKAICAALPSVVDKFLRGVCRMIEAGLTFDPNDDRKEPPNHQKNA